MKTSAFYSRFVVVLVLTHIGFLALHRWIGERLELASTERYGAQRWWIVGGFVFFIAFAITATIALRLSGKTAAWLPKSLNNLLLCGSAVLSAALLVTSALLDLPKIQGQMLEYHMAFVSTLLFEGGFIYFFAVLFSSMVHERSVSVAGRAESRRFAEAFAAGRKVVLGSK